MKTKKSIQLTVAAPCQQSWNQMQISAGGKFCSSCEKTVVDFSQMSDKELLHFFQSTKTVHCGRFDATQLKRPIEPIKNPHPFFGNFKKIAAATVTIFSLKTLTAESKNIQSKEQTTLSPTVANKTNNCTDSIIISGIVRNFNGRPLENAAVSIVPGDSIFTDKEGRFSFTLNSAKGAGNIYFSYDTLITAVRSYHPLMQSTFYDVTLYQRMPECEPELVMGVPAMMILDLPSLTFKKNNYQLSSDTKLLLHVVATKLKNHPGAALTITAYPDIALKKQQLANKRIDAIVHYLIEKMGISKERLNTDKVIKGGDENTIDFISP